MKKWMMLSGAVLFTVAMIAGSSQSGTADEAIEISDVMQEAMKGGLCKKVVDGEASADEKARLLVLLKAMAECEAPKGDAESWNAKTAALVKAAEGVVKGDADATAVLKGAANCKACHDPHRP